jgi:hypothetical protein
MKPKVAPKHVVKVAHRMSCYDFAWQSQDMQNCLAKHPEQTGQLPGGGSGGSPMTQPEPLGGGSNR